MKKITLALSTLCLLLFQLTAQAATYSQPIFVSFGASLTGQAANVRVTVTDNAGTVQIAATNAPSGNAFTESTDAAAGATTGIYRSIATIDTSWLPVRVKFTLVGQAGVAAEAILGSDRAAALADGYTAARGANLANLDVAVSTRNSVAPDNANIGVAATQAAAANGKLLGNVAAQTGDAYARIGANGAGLTGVGLAAGQNVATVGGLAPPTNWNLFAIDGTGKVAVNNLPAFPSNFGTLGIDGTGRFSANTLSLAPSGSAGGDPFALPRTGTTYANNTWGLWLNGQLANATPTAVQIRQEIDTNSTQLAALVTGQAALSTAVGGVPAASVSALLASARWQKMEAVEVGAYTRSGNVYTFTRQDGTTFTMTLNALASPTTRTPGS